MRDDKPASAPQMTQRSAPKSTSTITPRSKTGHSAKRNRLTWFLAAALLCLTAGIVYLETQERSSRTLPTRVADDVQVITITRAGSDTVRVERSANPQQPWKITAPVQLPANEQRIIPLLTVYTNPDPGYATSSVDLVATGLDSPEISVMFDDYPVKIGQVTVDGSRRHALHGTRVRFVPDWVFPFLQGGVSALADLTLWGDGLISITDATGAPFNDAALTAAKALLAQQYVSWPRTDNPPILQERTFTVETSADDTGSAADDTDSAGLAASTSSVNTDGTAGTSRTWIAYATDQYAALTVVGTDYAYIVPLDEVPWLFSSP